jgi:ssDNA-binding Zn-finger/Zn-ribbon topoisomerase 1
MLVALSPCDLNLEAGATRRMHIKRIRAYLLYCLGCTTAPSCNYTVSQMELEVDETERRSHTGHIVETC